jgi:hypothetical protein
MVVNFRARGINRGMRKLAWTPTSNLKKKKIAVCKVADQLFSTFLTQIAHPKAILWLSTFLRASLYKYQAGIGTVMGLCNKWNFFLAILRLA